MGRQAWIWSLSFCICALGHLLGAQKLASAKPPIYPLAAKAAGIDGPVVLKGTISQEGKMQDIHVISGRLELQQAAIDAVTAWTYKPYKHFGQIVEVNTTVTVNFNMGVGAAKAAEQAKAVDELTKARKSEPLQDTLQPTSPKI